MSAGQVVLIALKGGMGNCRDGCSNQQSQLEKSPANSTSSSSRVCSGKEGMIIM
jgi:hypothetical protein